MKPLAGPCARLLSLHKHARASFSDFRRFKTVSEAGGLIWRHLSFPSRRHFTSSILSRAKQPPLVKHGTPPYKPKTPAVGEYLLPHVAAARTLASKGTPTILYQATSSNIYPIACYAVSGFSVLYAVWNFYDVLITEHKGLWRPVLIFMGTVCALVMGLGLYIGRNATRLVKRLTAVPVQLDTGKGPGSKGLLLRIEKRKLMPFGSPKTLDVKLEDAMIMLKVSEAMHASDMAYETVPTTESGKRRVERLQREAEVERGSPRSKPGLAGAVTKGTGSFMVNFRRIVTREGMIDLWVGRRKVWWLDPRDAWFLERGSTLERLLLRVK